MIFGNSRNSGRNDRIPGYFWGKKHFKTTIFLEKNGGLARYVLGEQLVRGFFSDFQHFNEAVLSVCTRLHTMSGEYVSMRGHEKLMAAVATFQTAVTQDVRNLNIAWIILCSKRPALFSL